jgi:hypothetical protein
VADTRTEEPFDIEGFAASVAGLDEVDRRLVEALVRRLADRSRPSEHRDIAWATDVAPDRLTGADGETYPARWGMLPN